jgi:hypothetical protein
MNQSTEADIDLDKLEALPPQLRGAARQLRQYLKLVPGTVHWADSQQSSACDEAAGFIERALTRRAAPDSAAQPDTTASASIDKMREMLNCQGQSGNWNCNSYMHGMYNGMEYMLAMLENREPVFRSAPKVWLDNIKRPADRAQVHEAPSKGKT